MYPAGSPGFSTSGRRAFLARTPIASVIITGESNACTRSICTHRLRRHAVRNHGRHRVCLRARHCHGSGTRVHGAMAEKLRHHMARCLSDGDDRRSLGAPPRRSRDWLAAILPTFRVRSSVASATGLCGQSCPGRRSTGRCKLHRIASSRNATTMNMPAPNARCRDRPSACSNRYSVTPVIAAVA